MKNIISLAKNKYPAKTITAIFACLLVLQAIFNLPITLSMCIALLLCFHFLFVLKVRIQTKETYKAPLYLFSIIAILFFTSELIYPSFAFRLYYTLKNGQKIELESYSIKLSFPEWFIGRRDLEVYEVMPDFWNKMFIVTDFNQTYVKETLNNLCDQDYTQKMIKKYADINGTEYLCKNKGVLTRSFLSDDGHFFSVTFLDNRNLDIEKLYNMFLNSVKKKP
jgi:hypothetical protein